MAATCITLHKIGLTAAFALALSSVAPSTTFAYSARAQQMCMGDAMRLCSSEIPSIARITSCMRRNKANVSPGCRAVMDEMDGTAARAKPPEQKPAAVARTQSPAAARPAPVQQKPAAAPVVAQPAAPETKPSEQKPPVASRVEQPIATSPPAQAAPVEAALPAQAPALGSLAAVVVRAVQTASVEREPAVAAPRDPTPSTELNSALRAPDTVTPTVTPPVAQPHSVEVKAVEAKPAQAATVEHKAAVAAPADVKPAAVKSTVASKPATTVARKQKQRQVRMARYDHRDADIDRAMAIALPMLSAIMQSW